MPRLRPATCAACLAAALVVTGCGWFPAWEGRSPPAPDPSTATYRAAMAAFSDCATAASPQDRAASAATLQQAAAQMAADTTPANPDHFFMADRVAAAHRYCAEAAAR